MEQGPLEDGHVLKRMFIEYLDTEPPIRVAGYEIKPSEALRVCCSIAYNEAFVDFVERLDKEQYNRVINLMSVVAHEVREKE